MTGMRVYRVVIGGIPHWVQLDEVTAARYGDAAVLVDEEPKAADKPANKARRPANKEG